MGTLLSDVKFDTFFVQTDRGKWFRDGGDYRVDYGAFDLKEEITCDCFFAYIEEI